MRHAISHDLGLELACKTARAACDDYARRFARYQLVVQWQGPQQAQISFAAKGVAMTGEVLVSDRELVLDLKVPLLLRPLQGRALEIIDREFRRWLERARQGEIP